MRNPCSRIFPRTYFILFSAVCVVMLLILSHHPINAANVADINLTSAERQYLLTHDPLVFVSQTNYPPFEFLQKDSSMDGMGIELARWMSTELGIKVQFRNMNLQQAQEAVLSGEADILTSLFYSEKRTDKFSFSEPLFDVPASIFVSAERPDISRLEDLRGKRIAMPRGDYAKDFLESKGISYQLVQTDSFAQAMDAVISAQADALIGDEQIVRYHLYSNRLTNKAKKVGEPLYTGKNCMAVRKGNEILYSIVAKSLKHARETNVLVNLQHKWLGVEFTDVNERWARWFPLVSGICLALIVAAGFFMAINYRLRKLVFARTWELQKERQFLSSIIENATEGVCVCNDSPDFPHVRFTVWNPCMTAITGYSLEEINHLGWNQALSPEGNPRAMALIDEIRRGNRLLHEQCEIVCSDGKKKVLSISTATILSDDQNVNVLCIMDDITQQVEAEEQLRFSEAMYSGIFNNIGVGVSVISPEMKILSMNPTMKKWFPDTNPADGRNCYTSFNNPSCDTVCEYCPVVKTLHDGAVHEVKTETTSPHGIRNYKIVSTPILDSKGQVTTIVEVFEDITEHVNYELKLKQAKDAAEAANYAKSEFLANMSHEIRTPMNGVIGMAQLLEFTGLTQDQIEYVTAIKISGANLLSLINDILDLSKIEAGKIEIESTAFSLRTCINDIVLTQKSVIQDKRLFLEIDIATDVPHVLVGDQLRVKQILLNLLGNAVKFTSHGGITITVLVIEQYETFTMVKIAVRDTGIGISAEARDKIFNAFIQEDGSTTHQFGGTGLGLTISRRLAELMNGNISVESTPGAGSCFELTLPFQIVHRDAADERPSPQAIATWNAPPLRILLVEDNLINITFEISLLSRVLGHEVLTAENGKECLEKLAQGAFDFILMDIQMPVMNGIDALREIRRIEQGTAVHQPVIALTAYALRNEKERFLQQGFDGYVSKPLDINELISEMKRVTGNSRSD